jgi:hypothetical protein
MAEAIATAGAPASEKRSIVFRDRSNGKCETRHQLSYKEQQTDEAKTEAGRPQSAAHYDPYWYRNSSADVHYVVHLFGTGLPHALAAWFTPVLEPTGAESHYNNYIGISLQQLYPMK